MFNQSIKVELLESHTASNKGVMRRAGKRGDVLFYDDKNPNASQWSHRELVIMVKIGVAKFVEV